MIKIFLSHSSTQKPFMREMMTKELSHNTAIVDKYTFKALKEIWNEIRDVPDGAVVAAVPAKIIKYQPGYEPAETHI